MIDTDKYEGHRRGKWSWGKQGSTDNGDGTVSIRPFAQLESKSGVTLLAIHHGDAKPSDFNLIADAPDLLAEVERLREDNRFYTSILSRMQGTAVYDNAVYDTHRNYHLSNECLDACLVCLEMKT